MKESDGVEGALANVTRSLQVSRGSPCWLLACVSEALRNFIQFRKVVEKRLTLACWCRRWGIHHTVRGRKAWAWGGAAAARHSTC